MKEAKVMAGDLRAVTAIVAIPATVTATSPRAAKALRVQRAAKALRVPRAAKALRVPRAAKALRVPKANRRVPLKANRTVLLKANRTVLKANLDLTVQRVMKAPDKMKTSQKVGLDNVAQFGFALV